MTALNRKLFRDLWHMRTQSIAIGLVIACGVATFVMSLTTLYTLMRTRDQYYEERRFAHVFAQLKRAPNAIASRLTEIPGVQSVQARVAVGVTLDLPDMDEPAAARIISLHAESDSGRRGLHLRRGRWIEPGKSGEVLCNEPFAIAHGFIPGDKIKGIINGRLEELTIVGIALSPEYIYQIRPGEILPDNRRFGVLWMEYDQLAPAFDMLGAFNDLAIALAPGASEPDVLMRVDQLIEPYGGQGAYGREDQLSHRLVSDELTQLRAMAMIPPAIFLLVSAFLLNIVLNRIVGSQREQIAMLKSFGYTHLEVGWHYLKFALLIIVLGLTLGTGVGLRLGLGLSRLYTRFFSFPSLDYLPDFRVIALATGISGFAGVVGVIGAVARAVDLPPAEAMRPEPPTRYRATLIERMGLQQRFSNTSRIFLRQIERKPLRSLLTVLGIAMGVGVVVLGFFSKDMIDHVAEFQYSASQRYDYNIAFVEPSSGDILHDVAHLPGVTRAEGFRMVSARIRSGHRSRRMGIMGLGSERELFPLVDLNLNRVPLPDDGLVVSEKLGELMNLALGDRVRLEVLEGERPTLDLTIAGFIKDFSGLSAYMHVDALNRVMLEGSTLSGAFVAVDPLRTRELYRAIKETPRIASFSSRDASLESFRRTVAENLMQMRFYNIIFGCIIAFGVVYNNARITLAELSRELATLRVVGFTLGEISSILLGGIGTLLVLAIPLGLLIGYGFAALATAALETETQRFPLIVSSATFGYAVLITLVSAIVSAAVARRLLHRLDLVAVLKSRE